MTTSNPTRPLAKPNGSLYVTAVFAALIAYGSYQWWFNPDRAIKRRLSNVAAVLSAPQGESVVERMARAARLRSFFTDPVRVRLGAAGTQFESVEAIVTAAGAWTPPPEGLNVALVDVQVAIDTDSLARAYMTVETTTPDPRTGQPRFEMREAKVGLVKQDGQWLITSAEPNDLQHP